MLHLRLTTSWVPFQQLVCKMSDDSISVFLKRIQEGRDEEATAELWKVYYEQLVRVARRNLGTLPKRSADEDDVAQSAMFSFFRAAEAGRLTGLEHRDELWKLLLTIVIRKANRQKERAVALKRGGGDVRGESVFVRAGETENPGLSGVAGDEVGPEVLMGCQEMLELLDDNTLRDIALLRMEGFTVDEIAERIEVSRATVNRKLELIRTIWQDSETE